MADLPNPELPISRILIEWSLRFNGNLYAFLLLDVAMRFDDELWRVLEPLWD
jgi:hypothetical protein